VCSRNTPSPPLGNRQAYCKSKAREREREREREGGREERERESGLNHLTAGIGSKSLCCPVLFSSIRCCLPWSHLPPAFAILYEYTGVISGGKRGKSYGKLRAVGIERKSCESK